MESPISTNENLDQNIEDLALDSLEFKEYGEKLEIFHSVYWMSYPAIILSIWNIVLPYVVLPNSKQQRDLMIASVVSMLIAIVTFAWSYMNYKMLKNEKGAQHQVSMTSYKVEGGLYCISWAVIAFQAAFLIGIVYNQNNERLVMMARFELSEQNSQKFINAFQGIEILVGSIIIILFYKISGYTYHLEQKMNNRPITLGNFFGFYILSFVFLLFWRNADSLATAKNKDVVNIQSNFYQFKVLCWVMILATIFFILESKNISLKRKPRPNFYFLPMVIYVLAGMFMFQFTINLIQAEANQTYTSLPCIPSIQSFPFSFFNNLQCPKFDYENGDSQPFNLQCNTNSLGIFWEQDNNKPNTQKINQIGCIRMDCCNILKVGYSFWDNHLLSYALLNVFIGLVIAIHCYDLGQHNPEHLKSRFFYTNSKIIFQIVVPLLIIATWGLYQYLEDHGKPVRFQQQTAPPSSLIQKTSQKHNHNDFELFTECHPLINQIASLQSCSNLAVCFKGSSFVISPNMNNENFEVSNSENYFYGNTQTQLCVKGDSEVITSAMNEKIVYCTKDPAVHITATENCDTTPPPAGRLLINYDTETAKILVISAGTGLPQKDAKVYAVTGSNQCKGYQEQLTPKIKQSSTDKQGYATLYNIPENSDIYVSLDGFLSSCIKYVEQTEDEAQVISIVEKLDPTTELYKFVLTAQDASFNLNLGITFDYAPTLQCHVGIINYLCGHATYSEKAQPPSKKELAKIAEKKEKKLSKTNTTSSTSSTTPSTNSTEVAKKSIPNYSQVIAMQKLLKVKYLIYIFPLFTDKLLRQAYYQDLKQMNQNNTNNLNTLWTKINNAKPVIQVFFNKQTSAIYTQSITFPTINGRNAFMAFCFDGNTFTFTPVNQVFAQISAFLPDASICQ